MPFMRRLRESCTSLYGKTTYNVKLRRWMWRSNGGTGKRSTAAPAAASAGRNIESLDKLLKTVQLLDNKLDNLSRQVPNAYRVLQTFFLPLSHFVKRLQVIIYASVHITDSYYRITLLPPPVQFH